VTEIVMATRLPFQVFLVTLGLIHGACAPPAGDLIERLENRDPLLRIRAITEITRTEQKELVPNLVDRLSDDDAAVRFAAMFALDELTGTRLGYRYSAPLSERMKAVEAWRQYLEQQISSPPASD